MEKLKKNNMINTKELREKGIIEGLFYAQYDDKGMRTDRDISKSLVVSVELE